MKLNIGCGKRNFGESWIHIDGSNYKHIHSHDIVNLPDWSPSVGGGHGIKFDKETGSYQGGADPRRDGYAFGF